MKKNGKKQMLKSVVFQSETRNIVRSLVIRSLMVLAVLSLCLVSGCRLFTIGG